jgi:hypothetical protein
LILSLTRSTCPNSQRKVFSENEQPKDPPNSSITTHDGAAVDVNINASNEAQTFDNGNNNIV